jgi:hypothetical protein
MYPSIYIPAITGKIYVIIENLTDIIEELNKDPSSAQGSSLSQGSSPAQETSSAQICALEGIAGLDGDGGGRRKGGSGGGGGRGEEGEAAEEERHGLVGSPEKGTQRPESKDFDLFRYLSANECLELIRLESTRQSLLRAQGFLEDKKQGLIRLARSRQGGK